MDQQPVGRELARRRSRALEDEPFGLRQAVALGEGLDRAFERATVHVASVQHQRGAAMRDSGELLRVDIDGNDSGAEGLGDLHGIAADAAGADDDGERPGPDARAPHRLIGRGQRIGDDGNIGETETGGLEPRLVHRTQTARRHDDVAGEAALDVVARHLLMTADGAAAAPAEIALAAGQHRRHDDALAAPGFGASARRDHPAAHLMTEREGQRVVEADAVIVVAEIGVADTAPRHLDGGLARGKRPRIEARAHQRRVDPCHHPAVAVGLHGSLPSCPAVLDRRARLGYYGIIVPIYRIASSGNQHDPADGSAF